MANIYVGNIPYGLTNEDVRKLFSPFGTVNYVNVVTDPATGRSKGFGFVDMDQSASRQAIEALNQTEVDGRRIVVNEAKPRVRVSDRPRSGMFRREVRPDDVN